jgi:hypothetical protein
MPFRASWSIDAVAGPSNSSASLNMQYYSMPTSLLMPMGMPMAPSASFDSPAPTPSAASMLDQRPSLPPMPSIEQVDAQLGGGSGIFTPPSPHSRGLSIKRERGTKRRADSIDSDELHSDHEHEVPEGVERDGMIWGMKVEDYRALSARERKRVRNRISARTFRAKRKGECGGRCVAADRDCIRGRRLHSIPCRLHPLTRRAPLYPRERIWRQRPAAQARD